MSFRNPTGRDLLLIGRGVGIGGICGMVPWVIAYLLVMHAILSGVICLLLLAACSVLLVRSHRALCTLKARTPDYSAIARMEREVWGESFGHAGAPETGAFRIPEGVAFIRTAKRMSR